MRLYAHTTLKKNVLSYIASADEIDAASAAPALDLDLYQIEQNKIYFIRRINKKSVKTLFGAFPITIDYTEFINEGECYQVPVKYKTQRLLHKVFKRSPSSWVEWVFVYEEAELKENYFYVPDHLDINSPAIKADLMWCLHGGL